MSDNGRSNVRQFARGDAARLHCHPGKRTRVRRFNDEGPPVPEVRQDSTWQLATALGLMAVGVVIIFYALYQIATVGAR